MNNLFIILTWGQPPWDDKCADVCFQCSNTYGTNDGFWILLRNVNTKLKLKHLWYLKKGIFLNQSASVLKRHICESICICSFIFYFFKNKYKWKKINSNSPDAEVVDIQKERHSVLQMLIKIFSLLQIDRM